MALEKVRDYLLAHLPENDKSGFFERAGYTQDKWQRLADDLRSQILPLTATLSRQSVYGDYYTVEGALVGPNGRILQVITVWLIERQEVFNALGETVKVIDVPASAVVPVRADEMSTRVRRSVALAGRSCARGRDTCRSSIRPRWR